MKRFLILSALCSLLSAHAPAQTKTVTKTISTNAITESLTFPSGKTLTIAPGATLNATGATITGISASAAWADITGKPTEFTPAAHNQAWSTITSTPTTLAGYGITDAITAATAASTYQPLDADLTSIAALTTTTFGRFLLTQADASAARSTLGLGTLATQNGTISDYLTTAAAASTYHPLTATSIGGNGSADDGKLAIYNIDGSLMASSVWAASFSAPFTHVRLEPTKCIFQDGVTTLTVQSAGTTGTCTLKPGTVITSSDTGTVTNTMLAGSIALSKLAITGTPDGTKYLRDDGSWQTVTSGATLGANTFTGLQQFSGTTHAGLRLNNLTTTQRDAIASPQAGMIVWNSTTGRMSVHDGSSWTSGMVRLSGDTMTGQLQITQGTIASSAPLNITQTWNSGTPGTGAFSMLTLNATLTNASSTSSGFLTCIRDGTTRFFMDSGGVAYFGGSTAGTATCVIDPNNTTLSLRSNAYLNWMGDTYLYRDGTASNLQMGIDAASPVAQIFKAHDGSGSNIDGASLTLSGGRSTGTGDDGDVIFRTTMTGSSGSSLNTPQTRQHIQARFVNLTESTATNLTSIALASGKVTGGTATLTVWASDGTDHQALTSEVRFSAVNKAGTVTATCTQTDGTTAASTGTLTVTYDATASGNNLLLRANATSSLTQTILRCRLVITALNGDDVQTVTPQ